MTTHPLTAPVFSPHSNINNRETLADNAVHLWLLDINQFTADHYAYAEQIMNSEERERAQKFVRGKNEYIASRWLLRKVLARYTGLAVEQRDVVRLGQELDELPRRVGLLALTEDD